MNKEKTIIWLTGLSCSGKTTIAREIQKRISADIIDGDEIREITSNKKFSRGFRKLNNLYVGEMAHRLSKYNNVVVALISPIRSIREDLKKRYPNLKEVYLSCPLDVCIVRDVKGLWIRARNGEIKKFTGNDSKYDIPQRPDLKIETDKLDLDSCVEKILELIK